MLTSFEKELDLKDIVLVFECKEICNDIYSKLIKTCDKERQNNCKKLIKKVLAELKRNTG